MIEKLELGSRLTEDFYKSHGKNFELKEIESQFRIGQITEKEKFRAAKQILLGLAILYLFTLMAYLIRPVEGNKLLDITTVTFPPLATLILAAYFRDKNH